MWLIKNSIKRFLKLVWNGFPRIKFIKVTSFKNLKIRKIYVRKISMHYIIIFSFDNALFTLFYFDTTLMYFLNSHFSFFLCDKCIVVISKVHYKSIIFLEFIQFFYDDSTLKSMITWIIKILIMLIFNIFKFYICMYNPQ